MTAALKDGAYVKGLFLEGAGWNWEHSCLSPSRWSSSPDADHPLRPSSKESRPRACTPSPLYLYRPHRLARAPSFMLPIELKSGTVEPVLTKRGTALLLALAE